MTMSSSSSSSRKRTDRTRRGILSSTSPPSTSTGPSLRLYAKTTTTRKTTTMMTMTKTPSKASIVFIALISFLCSSFFSSLSSSSSSSCSYITYVSAANNNNNDDKYNYYQGDDQYNNDVYNFNDDNGGNAAGNDDGNNNNAAAAANDDGNNNNNNNNGANNDDGNGNNQINNYNNNKNYDNEAWEDDLFHWNPNVGFDGVSIMPVSCVNYNNGHMIKFEMFETENSYQCHFAQIGTFVVSIAHYMRAYFNYQALVQGKDFQLPSDAGYLNCIQLQESDGVGGDDRPLYAKIGCMERETFTSTRLQLRVYKDQQCSVPYDDGESTKTHATKGYQINGITFSTRVTFRPPFYTCQSCNPDSVSDTFNKKYGTWYDDDYINAHGQKQQRDDDDGNNNGGNNAGNGGNNDDAAANNNNDDQAGAVDDTYMSANDDVANYNNGYNYNYNYNGGNRRSLTTMLLREQSSTTTSKTAMFTAADGELEQFEYDFWRDVQDQVNRRKLYDNQYSIDDWNMCQRVYQYGLWCDEQCRSLDAFRTDSWSGADIILLSIMCTFMAAMMLLIVAKRMKVSKKQQMYGDETMSMPGLPPTAMFAMFVSYMVIIIVLAILKFVNETLVFAVVTCVLLFIYMLKLTLFDNRRPILLAAPKHDMFDNPLDQKLFA